MIFSAFGASYRTKATPYVQFKRGIANQYKLENKTPISYCGISHQ